MAWLYSIFQFMCDKFTRYLQRTKRFDCSGDADSGSGSLQARKVVC